MTSIGNHAISMMRSKNRVLKGRNTDETVLLNMKLIIRMINEGMLKKDIMESLRCHLTPMNAALNKHLSTKQLEKLRENGQAKAFSASKKRAELATA